jgi:hypothetical protein
MRQLLLCLMFFVTLSMANTSLTRDLDGDGKIERVVLDGKREPALRVFHGRKLMWQGIPRGWKPWKLDSADMDGDGKREIVLGVHKATRFFPRPHNCLFIYGWDGKIATKKWLGSSLSKPFSDFAFGQLDKDAEDELVALETLRDGRLCVVVYSWNGFGFDSDWQNGSWPKARLIAIERGKVIVEVAGRRVAIKPQEKTP